MGPTYVAALTMELAYANALAKMNEFITALRSEHTIVSAVAPSADDTAGDHLHDENVIHIFFTTMLAELCVLCLLRGGADVPVISITTVINGIITTSACCSFAMAQKQLFRFGNKKRWRSPYKPTLVWRTIRYSWRAFQRARQSLQDKAQSRREERQHKQIAEMKSKLAQPGSRLRIKIDKAGKPILPSRPQTNRSQSHQARMTLHVNELHDGKWVEMSRRVHLSRFTLAWSVAIIVYLLACWLALTYGVMFEAPAFTELLIAWLLSLAFTWIVVEPGEVLGLVLFPSLASNERLMACREKLKELGIWG